LWCSYQILFKAKKYFSKKNNESKLLYFTESKHISQIFKVAMGKAWKEEQESVACVCCEENKRDISVLRTMIPWRFCATNSSFKAADV
jgi:hypothetical protein